MATPELSPELSSSGSSSPADELRALFAAAFRAVGDGAAPDRGALRERAGAYAKQRRREEAPPERVMIEPRS